MSFLSNVFGAIVNTALAPVAIVKDAVDIVTGETPKATEKQVAKILDNVDQAIDDVCDGDVL